MCSTLWCLRVCHWVERHVCACACASLCVARSLNSFAFECMPIAVRWKSKMKFQKADEPICLRWFSLSLRWLLRPFFDLAWLRNGASVFKAFYTFTVTWLTSIDVTLMHTDTAEIWLNCGSKLLIRPFCPIANSPASQRPVMTMIQWFHKLHIRLTISIGKLPSRWGVECRCWVSGVICRIHLEMCQHWKTQLSTIVVAFFH